MFWGVSGSQHTEHLFFGHRRGEAAVAGGLRALFAFPWRRRVRNGLTIMLALLSESMSDQLARYEEIEVLNDGASGIVRLCEDKQTKQKVAVKWCMSRDEAEREGNALTVLKHPNIIGLIEMFHEFPYDIIVLEYGGSDLVEVLESSATMSLDNIKTIMRGLLSALEYIHAKGYIHRDVKPANVLVSEDLSSVKLIDFGLCRPRDSEDTQQLGWTPPYAPLDTLLGQPYYDEKFDIWGAGCVMAQLFTRKMLFDGDGELGVALEILKILGTPSLDTWPESKDIDYCQTFRMPEYEGTFDSIMESVPPLAVDLMKRMLTVSQSGRISASDALKHEFFA